MIRRVCSSAGSPLSMIRWWHTVRTSSSGPCGHSSWERDANENTNGLIREYFPKRAEVTDGIEYL